ELSGRLMDKQEALGIGEEINGTLQAGANQFIVDLSKLEYMNSTGLNILINLVSQARSKGGEMVVAGSTPRISSLFTVTKLDTVFLLENTREEAFSRLNNSPKKI